MNKQSDLIAELTYRTIEQGGRSTPAFSGYRPQVKFPFSDTQTSGQQKFLDKEVVYPGDTVVAEIAIISTEIFEHKLKVGLGFEFRERSRIIGTGIIQSILNKDLLDA
jgi:translation elongation factor EF-Tu-like GTPase